MFSLDVVTYLTSMVRIAASVSWRRCPLERVADRRSLHVSGGIIIVGAVKFYDIIACVNYEGCAFWYHISLMLAWMALLEDSALSVL